MRGLLISLDMKMTSLFASLKGLTIPIYKASQIKNTVAKKKNKTQVQPDTETFKNLLDSLGSSFSSLRIPTITGSWLEKRHESAIKKLGTFIPDEFYVLFEQFPKLESTVELPAMASALFIKKKHITENDKVHPRFTFAIKSPRLPVSVEAVKGTPYQFGLCYELDTDEKGNAMDGKMFWAWCWAVIQKDGAIVIPKELRPQVATVTHRKPIPGYKGHGIRQSSVHFRQWCTPKMMVPDQGIDQAEHESFMACVFRQLLVFWAGRKDQWSVGVRKDGHRATFSIAPEHTSHYFADRDTVVNVDGKPKKIIHFVREHTRITGSKVKAHVRGLSEFNWKGYHCVVTAPTLNGSIFTDCHLSPVLSPKDDEKHLSMEDFADFLARAEDRAR